MTLTFQELWERTGEVAALLGVRGVKSGEVVAIALPRSTDLIVACLAVLRIGGVVLGLDLRSPAARNARIVSLARAAWSITRGSEVPACVVGIPSVDLGDVAASAGSPEPDLDPEAPGFLVFTSGSTGEPKGVILSHRALVARAHMERATYVSGQTDVSLFASSPGFIALPVSLTYLAGGAALLVVSEEASREAAALAAAIQEGGATHAGLPPRLIEPLMELPDAARKLASLRILCSVSEGLPAAVAARCRTVLPQCRLLDRYGATETSGIVTMADLGEEAGRFLGSSSGTCLPGVTVQLVDGEIWVASPALASGYLRGEDDGDPRFVTAAGPGEAAPRLWYRTGDAGRLAPDGRLNVLGRLDLQLNIDGVRADPREIENALCCHESVADAAVWTHPDSRGRARLIAYVVDRGEPATAAELRVYLAHSLPRPLIPVRFVRLTVLPLTPSGKLDRVSLPQPEAAGPESGSARTATESTILIHFRDVLGQGDLGVNDDFFDWGGDSLKATDLLARVASSTGVILPAAVILDHPTVEDLARRVAQGAGGAVTTTWLVRSGDRPPLVCLPGITGDPLVFLPLAESLASARPVLGVSLVGLVPPISIPEVVRSALAAVRAVQPNGPYLFLGYSGGGLIAFEMAGELRDQGESVAFVGLLDTFIRESGDEPSSRRPPSFRRRLRYLRNRVPPPVMAWLRDRLPRLRILQPLLGPTAVRGLSRALIHYRVAKRDLAVTLFRCQDSAFPDPLNGWGELARRGVTVRMVPGHHETLMALRNLRELSRQVSESLAALD